MLKFLNNLLSNLFKISKIHQDDIIILGHQKLTPDDTILLYAYSESIHSTINKWLDYNNKGKLHLVFCQCLWKCDNTDKAFDEALFSADNINNHRVRISFTTDAGAGSLLKDQKINKVLFGAYYWHCQSTRRVWFRNTPGTLSLAATASKFDIPIFVLAEKNKNPCVISKERGITQSRLTNCNVKEWMNKKLKNLKIGYKNGHYKVFKRGNHLTFNKRFANNSLSH